jgi:hypothetical protein
MRSARVLIIMAVALALAACGVEKRNNDVNTPVPGTSTFLASGGTSTSGSGGMGGYVNIQSYGAVKVLRSDTVIASSIPSVALPAPSFGTDPYIVSGGTMTVLLDTDESGVLCTFNGDAHLYIGDGDGLCDGNDTMVTGLTIDAGATLVLVDQGYWGGYGTLWLSNDLVVNGTITSTAPSVYIEANMIDVESAGKIVTSATTTDTSAGSIYLGCGDYGCGGNSFTNQIINRGSIEAKGLGNGSGGYLFFEPNDLVANYGAIDASGGDSDVGSGLSGGSGGELDVYVDYGDFYSSGIVRMNGGKGDTDGGDSEAEWCNYNCYSVYVETAYVDNTAGKRGDIIISGTWEANGGDGSGSDGANGRGGYGGYIYLQTDAMGAVMIDATMSAKGGAALAAGFPGGNAYYSYGIEIYSYNYRTDPATPGKISIAGKYDLRGGNGDEMGGNGGYLYINSNGYNSSNKGSDVEMVGFPTMIMNGGDGANGGSAASYAVRLTTNSPNGMPAGPITNEANIEARGGNAAATPASTGGSGGNVEMITNGISDPSEIITNSGTIDISGGTGDTGGSISSSMINLGAQHVTNSGNLTANGGNGTTGGGNGGNIYLNSYDGTTPTTNTGTLSVTEGTPGGSPGSVNIDAGGPL